MENNLHVIVGDPDKQTKNIHLPFKIEIVEDIFAEVRYFKIENYLYLLIFTSDINTEIFFNARGCQ